MDITDGVADLHMHTTASDGTSSVDDRITQAVNRELDTIAITDHDSISDELTDRVTEREGVELITGVEVRAELFDTKVELLGYYVDPTNMQLLDVLSQARQFRHERNEQLVANLQDVTDLSVAYEEIREANDGIVGRPHLAELLIDAGIVDSIGAAFDEYLASDAVAYVQMDRLGAETVIDAIHAAGGVASLAHPGRIRSDRVPEMVATLAELGLDGIEVAYPYDASGGPDAYADIDSETAGELAIEHGLFETGGSDCHGPDSGKFRIGEVRIGKAVLEELRSAAGV